MTHLPTGVEAKGVLDNARCRVAVRALRGYRRRWVDDERKNEVTQGAASVSVRIRRVPSFGGRRGDRKRRVGRLVNEPSHLDIFQGEHLLWHGEVRLRSGSDGRGPATEGGEVRRVSEGECVDEGGDGWIV